MLFLFFHRYVNCKLYPKLLVWRKTTDYEIRAVWNYNIDIYLRFHCIRCLFKYFSLVTYVWLKIYKEFHWMHPFAGAIFTKIQERLIQIYQGWDHIESIQKQPSWFKCDLLQKRIKYWFELLLAFGFLCVTLTSSESRYQLSFVWVDVDLKNFMHQIMICYNITNVGSI